MTLLTGCATGNPAASNIGATTEQTAIGISGFVHGGQNPIGGSTLTLWETTTGGYGNPATVLNTTTTTANGSFAFPVKTYNCTSGAYDYLTASGGDATSGTTSNLNPGILLVAMLGPCTGVGSNTDIIVNEVTTIAAAYALSGFAVDFSPTVYIGTTSNNIQGLNDAMANASLLVNPAGGSANISTSTVLLPTAMIYTLANTLAACVNSSYTGTGNTTPSSSCANLFSYTTPPIASATAPIDTFQAALNMAKYPGNNVANLLSMGVPTAPYGQTVAVTTVTTGSSSMAGTAPNDLTLGIGFTNASISGAYNSPTTLAIDKADNVFVIGASGNTTQNNYALGTPEWLGKISASSNNATTPYTASSATSWYGEPETALIDSNNNIWIGQNYAPSSSEGSIIEIPNETVGSGKNILLYDPSGSNLYEAENTWAIAIDSSSNIYTSSYRGAGSCAASYAAASANTLCEVEELSVAQQSVMTPVMTDTFGSGGIHAVTNTTRGLFIDSNTNNTSTLYDGNIWATNYDSNILELVNPSTGALTYFAAGTSSSSGLVGVALDKSSNVWVTNYSGAGLYEVPAGTTGAATTGGAPAATAATAASPSTVASAAQLPSTTATQGTPGGLLKPKYLAIDGAGNVFVANYGYNGIVEYSPAQGKYMSPYYGFNPSLTVPATPLPVTAYSINGSNVVTIYATNNLNVGEQVTLSGFQTSTFLNGVTLTVLTDYANDATASSSSFTHASMSKTTESGTATVVPSNQAIFTCTAAAASTCSIVNGAFGFNNNVAIDKAGSVWTLSSNGTAVEMIGLGAPTDPILSDGLYGVEP